MAKEREEYPARLMAALQRFEDAVVRLCEARERWEDVASAQRCLDGHRGELLRRINEVRK